MKIKKILVSQPEPSSDKNPYFEVAEKNNVKIDFRPFIHVEPVPTKEFRKQRVALLDYTAVIFTSKTAIDHYFRIANDMRITVPDGMKYFCTSESIAHYLQKYIVYRKRKIFFGKGSFPELMELLEKHKDEKFLVPLSEQHKEEIPLLLNKHKLSYKIGILYQTVSSDLSDLSMINYDVLVFFSPSGIKSLLKNFPDFDQQNIIIASFGNSTAQAVKEAGLRLDLQAPMPNAPSMTMALDQFIQEYNSKVK
ncbi:MAG: uroporphyrinogen-III synthase [Bacteroidales bacterium]|nr:uroporphyrinogen-III synthase [Bacteroidales bacterium]MBN2817423.1 uroporphyrinogen-III synthase [Bacteroidales bacterium]